MGPHVMALIESELLRLQLLDVESRYYTGNRKPYTQNSMIHVYGGSLHDCNRTAMKLGPGKHVYVGACLVNANACYKHMYYYHCLNHLVLLI